MLLDEDKIVLRTPKYSRRMQKDVTVYTHFLVLILIILFYHVLIDYKSLVSLVFLWLAVICLKGDIDLTSYIVTLSREGVCIKSLFQEKKYKWEELKIKRYEAWKDTWKISKNNYSIFAIPKYSGCVYFSLTPPIFKKTEESPFDFWGSHRFSCICVCFMEKGFKWKRLLYRWPINVVDETCFKEKMREWNIKIKDYDCY